MIQHWNWGSLNDRGKDARLVMMYKVPNENAAIPKHNRLNAPFRKSLAFFWEQTVPRLWPIFSLNS
jgi:hypothetical protein